MSEEIATKFNECARALLREGGNAEPGPDADIGLLELMVQALTDPDSVIPRTVTLNAIRASVWKFSDQGRDLTDREVKAVVARHFPAPKA